LFDVDLPSYDKEYTNTKDFKSLGRLIPHEARHWREIWNRESKIKLKNVEVEIGDCAVIRMMNVPMHVAFITKKGWMLHVMEGIDVTHEQYTGIGWRDRFIAIYRFDKYVD
jgi:hypothetical protein